MFDKFRQFNRKNCTKSKPRGICINNLKKKTEILKNKGSLQCSAWQTFADNEDGGSSGGGSSGSSRCNGWLGTRINSSSVGGYFLAIAAEVAMEEEVDDDDEEARFEFSRLFFPLFLTAVAALSVFPWLPLFRRSWFSLFRFRFCFFSIFPDLPYSCTLSSDPEVHPLQMPDLPIAFLSSVFPSALTKPPLFFLPFAASLFIFIHPLLLFFLAHRLPLLLLAAPSSF